MVNEPESRKTTSLSLRTALAGLVLLASALEGWYGQPELFGDDISYLDVVNMIRLGDWKTALNPLWSIGYPLLLSVVRLVFPTDIAGEMRAVFCLNVSLSLACYVAFLWFVREVIRFHRAPGDPTPAELSPLSFVAATFAYLTAAIGCAKVSSIGPDLLVAGLFFVASGLSLRLFKRPSAITGVVLGVVLGLGYFAKAFFLPLAAIFLAILLFTCIRERKFASFAAAVVFWLVFVIPYASGLSWALGRHTLGESASLNYAFHVNGLPHWMGWQGGEPELGTPIHPVRLLNTDPPVFAFGEPFHVTYPPQYQMPYWYEGYRHFTRLGNAVRAIATNLRYTAGAIAHNAGLVFAILLCMMIAIRGRLRGGPTRGTWVWRLFSTWPWVLPPLLAILLYQQVHVEPRYIAGFVAVLAMFPILAIDPWLEVLRPRSVTLLLVLLALGGTADLIVQLRRPLVLALHRAPVQTEGQWRIAHFLTAAGVHPGDKVASVSDLNVFRCAWAYGARVRIVAAIGNDAYDGYPPDQLHDLHRFFDDAAVQAHVLELFRQQGAVAVVAQDLPFATNDPGWQKVPGTNARVLLLK